MQEEEIFYTGNEDNDVLCDYRDGDLNQYYTLMTCRQPLRAQFVQIQLNTTTWFHIYEVEVHGFWFSRFQTFNLMYVAPESHTV